MVADTDRSGGKRALLGEHEAGVGVILFAFLGPATAWTLHFLVCYFLVALYCTTGRGGATGVILGATAVFAVMSVAAGVVGYRAWDRERGDQGWAEAVTGGAKWSSFLLVMGMLSSVLFTLLIVLEGLPPLFVPACPEVAG